MANFQNPSTTAQGKNEEFYLQLARGHISNHSVIHNFGYNPDIDTGTDPETVWTYGGLYPWSALDIEQTLYVKSSSVEDTMSVTILGLDNNGLSISETITLTGTSAVTTTKKFKRIQRAFCIGTANHEGSITMHTVNDVGSVVGHIAATEGQTLMAIYTIPADITGYLLTGDCSVNLNKEVTIKFYIRQPGGIFRIAHVVELCSGSYRYDFRVPQAISAGSDLEIRVDNANDNNCRVSANFDIILIDN
jgi:hypothetical protein